MKSLKTSVLSGGLCALALLLATGCPDPIVNITIDVDSIELNETTASLLVGETLQLSATLSPAEPTNPLVAWSSSSDLIATVSEDGLVTAVASGTATISVSAENGSVNATCIVTVLDTFTVSFNTDGGTAIASVNVIEGNTLTRPADPVKDDFIFDGWFEDEALSDAWNFASDTLSRDLTLYAKWALPTYTVSFHVNGGSAVGSQSVQSGGTVTMPGAPSKTGYTFAGWFEDEALSDRWDFSDDTVTQDMPLHAKWTLISYSITYNLDGGTLIGTASYTVESADITLAEPTKDGYSFGGWYANASFSGEPVTLIASGSSGTKYLYAKWLAKVVIRFYSIGGSGSMAAQEMVEGIPEALNVNHFTSADSSYGFSGWATDENATEPEYADGAMFTAASSDVTLYAVWTCMYKYGTFQTGVAINGFTDSFKTDGNLTLPSTLDGKTVLNVSLTSVPDAIKGQIINLTIPDTVTTLSYRAFYNLGNMESVVLGSGITTIGQYVFYYCTRLESVTLPDNLKEIPYHMFAGCGSLTSITLPSELETIGTRAFLNSGLESVHIPAAVATISSGAFEVCTSLSSITVDAANENFKADNNILFTKDGTVLHLFAPGKSDTSYTVPEGVTTLKSGAFNSSNLSTIILPSTLTTMNESAIFGMLRDMTSIVIPEGVSSLGAWSFTTCDSMTSITLPSTLESVGQACFLSCRALESITLPAAVTTINRAAFSGCDTLASISIEATTPPAIYSFDDVFREAGNVPGFAIYVPAASVDAYKTSANWAAGADYIQAIPVE
jgi:uncharacterized repeat protein (TIGR02543 family)